MTTTPKTPTNTGAWKAPAPGTWELETVHMAGAQPKLFQRLATRMFEDGAADFAAMYGLPIEGLKVSFVHDHCYMQMRGLGEPAPKDGSTPKPPPDFVLKVLSRVHPAFRKRNRIARTVLAKRTWVAERERWYRTWRDETIHSNRALQGAPIGSMTDDDLLEHVEQVGDHVVRSGTLHFRLIPVCDLPVGRLLVACRSWGIDDAASLALMAGSSPASMASAGMVTRIAAACAAAGVRPASLDDIQRAGPEADTALQAYLDDRGWRVVTQYSPRGLTLHELPNVVVGAVVTAMDSPERPAAAGDASVIRAKVPAAERDRFDELLSDARAGYGVRDDNVTLTLLWPLGLLRRAMLEVGRRLVDRGTVEAVGHVMTLELDEMRGALAATGDERARWSSLAASRQASMDAADAAGPPSILGPPAAPPPDFALLPSAMADVTSAVLSMLALENAHDGTTTWTGQGTGIGTQPYTGRACVAADAQDALARLEPGDVLITTHTTPAYEGVLPITGALVTDHGGLTSHAALVSRELGLPAVLGVLASTTTIPNGATVTVDPVAGTVTVIQLDGG